MTNLIACKEQVSSSLQAVKFVLEAFRPKESGYINYERYWSRDPRFTAQIPGDTPTRFDWDGRTHRRLPIMEKLQDEMLEASEKRSKAKTGSS
ncbi:hypothetical protein Tcan_15774 [Toxocara canis]|uniref:Uncharacterized protein n=1 Tax=Toxocara canis TaxID=6265 RepID=A0A0B2V602_TOXCA|nr:hypothetical protein Tcan_15774 [Toxocara canis]